MTSKPFYFRRNTKLLCIKTMEGLLDSGLVNVFEEKPTNCIFTFGCCIGEEFCVC